MRVTFDHVTNHLEDQRNLRTTKCGVEMDRDANVKSMVYTNSPLTCKRCEKTKFKMRGVFNYDKSHHRWSRWEHSKYNWRAS